MKIGAYVLRRVLLSIPVLIGITLVTFGLAWQANEGHMERGYLTDKMTAAQRATIVEQYGFDDPWYVQYFNYLARLVTLDLGVSHAQNDRPITEVYKEFFPATLELTLAAIVIAVIAGVFLGTISAVRKDAPVDHMTRFLALSGVSVPIFWLGLILKFAFATTYPVELFTAGGIVLKSVVLSLMILIPLVAGLFIAEGVIQDKPSWKRLSASMLILGAVVGVSLFFGWWFFGLLLLSAGGAAYGIVAALKLVKKARLPRRVWYILPGVAVAVGIALAASPVASDTIRGLFDVIPDFPLGGRFSNDLVFEEGVHPSLTDGPTRILLVDTLLAGDLVAFNDVVLHLVLPGITLGYASLAVIARMMRSSMLEVLSLDFVRTARAKGLPDTVVIDRHARRNALIPIATVVGLTFGGLLSGAVLTETIFQWPGLGRWSTTSIISSDTNSIMAFVLLVVIIYLVANLVVDLVYSLLDPRVRLT